MDEIKAGENRPSEVFLALWYFRANREPLSAENFRLCAETWRALANREDRHAADEALALAPLHPEDSGPPPSAATSEPERYPITPIRAEDLEAAREMDGVWEAAKTAAAVTAAAAAVARTPHPAAEAATFPSRGRLTESGPIRTPAPCHSEEQSDEESSRSFAEAQDDKGTGAQDDKASDLDARKAVEAAKARSDAGAKGLITRKRNVRTALVELRAAGVKLQEIADADQRLTLLDVLQMLEAKPVSLPVLSALERAVSALRARDAGPSEEDMS